MDMQKFQQAKKILAAHGARFAYAFGSHAENREVASSDVDLAVSFDANSTASDRFVARLWLQQDLQKVFAPREVDLVVLNDTRSATLRYEIANKGKLIYEKNSSGRLDFELRAMNEYEDFAPFLADYNRAYQRANV